MNVHFECEGRSPFIIEVGYWDTVLEIKEKVQESQGIPVDRQTLIFNDKVLPENGNVGYCQIHNLSTIKLVITPPGNGIPGDRTDVRIVEPEIATPDVSVVDPLVRPEILPPNISQVEQLMSPEIGMPDVSIEETSMSEIQVNVRFATADDYYIVMMDSSDTVRSLKEELQELAEIGVPVENLMMRLNANVLQDHLSLLDSQVLNHSEVVASIDMSERPSSSSMPPPQPVLRPPTALAPLRPRAPVRASAPGTRIDKLILRVQQMYTIQTNKIHVEVNAFDDVEELRKKLEKMQEDGVLALPPEGYFFIHERIVMHEDKTFRWHSVRSGDLIEIWAGTITV